MKKFSRFTLIELLAVIVIIAILAGKVPLPSNGMFAASLLLMPLGAYSESLVAHGSFCQAFFKKAFDQAERRRRDIRLFFAYFLFF